MKLLSDRVKIEIIPEQEISEGGLYMGVNQVTGMRHNYFRGKVIEVGIGRTTSEGKHIPMNVKVGDIVIYPLGTYKRYDHEEKDYHIIYETDIYGILEGE